MKSFICTVELGSFTAAAKVLKVTTSMVSRNVTELEDFLGSRLINRSTNSISLTDAGERYYKEAKEIVEKIDNLNEVFKEGSKELSGVLNVLCPKGLTECMLMPFMMYFKDKYEDIQLNLLMSDDTHDLSELGYDVSIRSGILTPKEMNLVGRLIAVNKNVICASPEYLRNKQPINTPNDLLKHNFIEDTNLKNDGIWSFSKKNLEEKIRIKPKLTVNSIHAVKFALLHGYGIAMLPEKLANDELQNGTLITLLDEYEISERFVYVLYKTRKNTPKKVRLFVEEIVEYFK
ncbi:LysR family transcriptional regulator [Vibrio harveyi]|nr:LysR family transcriptional regulator [Vibrio harveyi]